MLVEFSEKRPSVPLPTADAARGAVAAHWQRFWSLWNEKTGYLFVLPFERARVDLLWFVGGVGTMLLVLRRPWSGGTLVFRPGAVFTNAAGATFDLAIDGTITYL